MRTNPEKQFLVTDLWTTGKDSVSIKVETWTRDNSTNTYSVSTDVDENGISWSAQGAPLLSMARKRKATRMSSNPFMAWAYRKLTSVTLRSPTGKTCQIRYGGKAAELKMKPGTVIRLSGDLSRY